MSTHRFYRNDPQNVVEVRPFDIYVAGLFHRRSLHILPPIHPPVGGEACNECGASGDMRVERAVSKPSKRPGQSHYKGTVLSAYELLLWRKTALIPSYSNNVI